MQVHRHVLRLRRAALAVAAVATVAAGGCSTAAESTPRDVHLGERPRRPGGPSTATVVAPPDAGSARAPVPTTASPTTAPRRGQPAFTGLIDPSGKPWGRPITFRSDVPVPDDLVFVLVVGSDARPHEDVLRAHADSVHLLAVDPRTRRATILGLPRDSWVEVPGHGNRKLTDSLQLGGPELVARTVEHLTGLPVDYYAITGFKGLPRIVDELGGVDIYVEHRMNDGYSGARFKPGWHHMNGEMVLNYSRNRHDVPNGDFSRSENQGKVILAALAKMRAEVGNDEGVRVWVEVLLRHAVLDTGLSTLRGLGALARSLDPSDVTNIVVPGKVGKGPGGASVVYLDERAAQIFADLRPDATIGSSGRAAASATTTTSSTDPPPEPSTTVEDGDEHTTTSTSDLLGVGG